MTIETISTSQDLASAIASGAVRSDCAPNVFEVRKPIENDPAVAGLQVRAFPAGWLYGAEVRAVLTGRSCFAYSGRGAAYEMTIEDGSIGWISDWRPADPDAFEAETNARRAAFFTPMEDGAIVTERYRWQGRFMGVRLPRFVRFIDARTPDTALSSSAPIVDMITRPYSVASTRSLSHYSDTRDLSAASYSAKLMRDLRSMLAEQIRRYRKTARQERRATARQRSNGGSVDYMPAIVVWQNYGFSIMGDPNRRAIAYFEPIKVRRQRKAAR